MTGLKAYIQAVWSTILYDTAGGTIVVGVSGGADSLALLHLLSRHIGPESKQILAVSVNHGLRPSSGDEAQFAAHTAAQWGMRTRIEQIDVNAIQKASRCSLEEAARLGRYRCLAQVAREAGTRFVAVAHHADDQIETVLMHLLRGSGLAGLQGMAQRAPMPEAPDLLLLRPLLTVWRTEIEAYCRTHHIHYIEDTSNHDTAFLRNRIRHELLPFLQTYNPQIKRRLQQGAEIWAADYALLQHLLADAWRAIVQEVDKTYLRFDLRQWQALSVSLQREFLRRLTLEMTGGQQNLSFEAVEQARILLQKGQAGTQAHLPPHLVLQIRYDDVVVTTAEARDDSRDLPQLKGEQVYTLPIPSTLALANGWSLTATWTTSVAEMQADKWQAWITCPTAETILHVRPRQRGEHFRPFGLHGSVTLKALMINLKIPRHARARWPLVADAQGVVWLPGYRLAQRAAVTPTSRHIAHLQLRQTEER